jgi:putative ribosome biogenesis GTPase RsgA
MGHGKSSFVKMLASDSDKDNIDARTHIKSVTSKCSLCKVNPVHNLLEDLYIVDTPGLDSENFDVFYILEKLN